MARIQVLPLPTETVGSVSSTPFVLIIDQLGGGEFPSDLLPAGMQEEIGYRTALVFDGDLNVANVDEKLHESAQAAVLRALRAEVPAEPGAAVVLLADSMEDADRYRERFPALLSAVVVSPAAESALDGLRVTAAYATDKVQAHPDYGRACAVLRRSALRSTRTVPNRIA